MKKLLIIFFCASSWLYADATKIHNQTDEQIYGGMYYVGVTDAQLASPVISIGPHETIDAQRPSLKLFFDRVLLFSESESEIKEKYSLYGLRNKVVVQAGYMQGSDFYIMKTGYKLRAYSTATLKLVPIQKEIHQIEDQTSVGLQRIGSRLLRLIPYSRMSEVAHVRTGNVMSSQEHDFVLKRKEKIKDAQEKLLGMKLEDDEVITVALCCSGGGYRAMIAALGFCIGAQQIGLFNVTMYISTLSGSTWFLASLLESSLSLQEYKQALIPRVKNNLFSDVDMRAIGKSLVIKHSYGQPLSVIDVYGGLLSQKLLPTLVSGADDSAGLEAQASRVKLANTPFPIYTCIIGEEPYEWVEFNPYEIGNPYLRGFIPTWSFGRKFDDGTSQDFPPSSTLGYFMGIWGSAFSSNVRDLIRSRQKELTESIRNILLQAIEERPIGSYRISPAKIWNFTWGLKKSPLSSEDLLTLVDAGVAFNLPFPPLFNKERSIDLIIALDASANIQGSKALKGMQAYAAAHNISFPQVNYNGLDSTICTIIGEPGKDTLIAYMPLIKNEIYSQTFDPAQTNKDGFTKTTNFSYTADQVELLSGLTEFNIKQSKEIIIQAMRKIVEAKRNKRMQ